jgi:hypothetical protein
MCSQDAAPPYVFVDSPSGFSQITELYHAEKRKIIETFDKQEQALQVQFEQLRSEIRARRLKAEQAFDAEILIRIQTKPATRSWPQWLISFIY